MSIDTTIENAKQPVVVIPLTALVTILGMVGVQQFGPTPQVSVTPDPKTREAVVQIQTQLEAMSTTMSSMNSTADRVWELYSGNRAKIEVLDQRVGRSERDIDEVKNRVFNLEKSPFGGKP